MFINSALPSSASLPFNAGPPSVAKPPQRLPLERLTHQQENSNEALCIPG
jgi:hypothetical protein